MKEILSFIQTYWREIAWAIGLVISIILVAIKKKPINTVTSLGLSFLPDYINAAEAKFGAGHGAEKLIYVLSLLSKGFEEDGVKLTSKQIKYFTKATEKILSTPKKKEDC